MQGAINQAENGLRRLDFRTHCGSARQHLLLLSCARLPGRGEFRQNEQPRGSYSHDKRTLALITRRQLFSASAKPFNPRSRAGKLTVRAKWLKSLLKARFTDARDGAGYLPAYKPIVAACQIVRPAAHPRGLPGECTHSWNFGSL